MAVQTVNQILTDASTLLTALETNPALSGAEQTSCVNAVAVIASVLPDLNAQNIISNAGRRNADVTNLHDNALVPMIAVDQSHVGSGGLETSIYDAANRIDDAITLIVAQVGSTDVTY
jgi:hypothetical protein